MIFTDCSTPPKTIYFTTYADLPQNNFSDTNDILIFYFTRNRKCKSKRRESKQSISDGDAFNNEDLDDILFRHQDEEVLDDEDRPLKPKRPRENPDRNQLLVMGLLLIEKYIIASTVIIMAKKWNGWHILRVLIVIKIWYVNHSFLSN